MSAAKKASTAIKAFVLDTNVLLHDPESICKFPNNEVIIPVSVLEELDKMKRLPSEVGKNSRAVIRFLDDLRAKGGGSMHEEGIKLDNDSVLRLQIEIKTDFDPNFQTSVVDNRIILAALWLQDRGRKVVFVSKDFAARLKAEAVGIEAQDYQNLKFSYDVIYRGLSDLKITKSEMDHFLKDGLLKTDKEFRPNEYCSLISPESTGLAKYNSEKQALEPLLKPKNIWGIEARNPEQRCAIDLLLRDDIKLVSLVGAAGTGKTLLALACGLRKVFDDGIYSRILVSRPIVPLGRDIGYLPGTKEEKLFHWMQPIYDNLEYLCESSGHEPNETLRWVLDSKKVEMEAVTYIRGRSIPRQYFIIDEAQNLTPHEIKTIISRAGEGTKVVLTGDPTQIDNPYLDKDSNGLTYVVGRFNEHAIYGHMYLDKTERSALAALAAEIM
ncbi:MAG: PhoH family protein [Chlamydiales bacterium]|nr:PhoH family protein [Chlamydiales bacterium]